MAKILLIEDDPQDLDRLMFFLKQNGYAPDDIEASLFDEDGKLPKGGYTHAIMDSLHGFWYSVAKAYKKRGTKVLIYSSSSDVVKYALGEGYRAQEKSSQRGFENLLRFLMD